ncbi:MAG: ABC transporter permease [Defluviitaleaceae bacterium]|nr:ABC transporter permease [Defluviitaleaceae bacterium]
MSTTTVGEKKFSILDIFRKIPFSTRTVGALYIAVLVVGMFNGFTLSTLISNSLHLFGVWAVFALANVPSIQSGTGPNFALPIGIVNGLLAMVIVLATDLNGMSFILASAVLAIIFGSASGYLYGKLMNAVKGSEMAIAPYTGFAVTAAFGLVWLAIPIRHPHMIFFLGDGLRHQIPLDHFNANFILSEFMAFEIFGFEFRTGELLVVFAACFLMWLFFRTKAGIAISAVGRNPMFARASGINVDRSRIIANMISTAVAALGVIVYAQGFGFVQLYDFPMFLAFPAVACILVGGATGQRARVLNVVVGTFLFQGLIATALPVFTRVLAEVDADITNQVRMVIQNGIILYALSTMSGGGK